MLKVKTYIAISTIKGAGTGLFAKQKIKKGTVIWQFDGNDYEEPEQELFRKGDSYISMIKNFAYFDNKRESYVMCADWASYMNHSDTPNTSEIPFEIHGQTIASKDIEKGEEIFCDYYKFDGRAKEKLSFKK